MTQPAAAVLSKAVCYKTDLPIETVREEIVNLLRETCSDEKPWKYTQAERVPESNATLVFFLHVGIQACDEVGQLFCNYIYIRENPLFNVSQLARDIEKLPHGSHIQHKICTSPSWDPAYQKYLK